MRTLTRAELTVALAARQMLLERRRLGAAAAIRRLTPLQGQEPRAPYVALAARLDGFSREQLQAALQSRTVVKSTLMRTTLHLVHSGDYPAYAQLARQARLRTWRNRYPHLDERRVTAELRRWLLQARSNDEIRERIGRYDGVSDSEWEPVLFARTLLPLVQLPPAGFWNERRRAQFVVDPRPLPDPVEGASLVVQRYLSAFGPATRADIAAWAGVAQRDLAPALDRLPIVDYRDERGAILLDLPDQPLPPASTRMPVRFLARWEQPLLAYRDRERILPAEISSLNLTLSGDQTVTVDGRVLASWRIERHRDRAVVIIEPHLEVRRAALGQIREEAKRTGRFVEPDARSVEVAGV